MTVQATMVPNHIPSELIDDWAFDKAPGIHLDPAAAMDALRRGPGIVYAPAGRRGKGTWVVKKYDWIVEAFQKPDLFSSDRYSGFSALLGEDWPMLPLEVDPPAHRDYRNMMARVFSPAEMARLEIGVAETARQLIQPLMAKHDCDFMREVGVPLPTTVFLRLMGLPLGDAGKFLEWERNLMHGATLDDRASAARSIKQYLVEVLEEREREPRNDVLSYVATAEIAGRRLDLIEKLGICFTLYGAGLDTVAAALGFVFAHLATHPEDQELLRNDPGIRAKSVDEFLRAKSMVVSGRIVTRDVEFHGVAMKRGDFVSLPTQFANRDPDRFPDASRLDFGREDATRPISFGAGPHNCLGAHLARREIRIVLDEWLTAMPPFRLQDGEDARTYGGSVFGVEYLPLKW